MADTFLELMYTAVIDVTEAQATIPVNETTETIRLLKAEAWFIESPHFHARTSPLSSLQCPTCYSFTITN